MPMVHRKPLTPVNEDHEEVVTWAMSEVNRLGATREKVGMNGVEGIQLFSMGKSLILGFEYGLGKIWTANAYKTLALLSSLPDMAGSDRFWETIKHQRIAKAPLTH